MITVKYRIPKSYSLFDRVFYEAEDDGKQPNTTEVKKTTVKKSKSPKGITPEEPDTTDYTQDVETEGTPKNKQENNDDTNAQQDGATDAPAPDDATDYTQDTETDDQSEPEDSPQDGDEATDYTQDTEGDAEGADDTTDAAGEPEETATPQDDSTPQQRYDIYKSILDLHEHVNIYINKLGDIATFNKDANLVITTVTSKLKLLAEKIHDYLTITFTGSTYLQSVYFFQSAVAVVKELINLLHNNAIFLKGSTN